MILKVPIERQDKDSLDCGIACLSMLLEYYGIKKSVQELKKSIKIYDSIGTYVPQLGIYLLENGFDVEIITLNPHIFTNTNKKLSHIELLSYLEEKSQKSKIEKFEEPLKLFIKFLEMNGKIIVKVPELKDIEQEIKNKRPVGALITSNFLEYDKAIFNFHFNIITGIDEKYIYVNDPMHDERGGAHKYLINEFIYALYASAYGDIDNASLLIVKKRTL